MYYGLGACYTYIRYKTCKDLFPNVTKIHARSTQCVLNEVRVSVFDANKWFRAQIMELKITLRYSAYLTRRLYLSSTEINALSYDFWCAKL